MSRGVSSIWVCIENLRRVQRDDGMLGGEGGRQVGAGKSNQKGVGGRYLCVGGRSVGAGRDHGRRCFRQVLEEGRRNKVSRCIGRQTGERRSRCACVLSGSVEGI